MPGRPRAPQLAVVVVESAQRWLGPAGEQEDVEIAVGIGVDRLLLAAPAELGAAPWLGPEGGGATVRLQF